MTTKSNDFNRNPNGSNQWETRSNEEIQIIINKHPKNWTKKDFRGEGKNNKKKILTRKETERAGLVFGNKGGVKQYQNGKLKCSMCGFFKNLEEFPDDNIDHQMVKEVIAQAVISSEIKSTGKVLKKYHEI